MKGDHSGVKVVCPYYVKESDRSITCEGIIRCTETMIKFSSPRRKLAYQDVNCNDFSYSDNCPVARAIAGSFER